MGRRNHSEVELKGEEPDGQKESNYLRSAPSKEITPKV
jgi:hypothetical protein